MDYFPVAFQHNGICLFTLNYNAATIVWHTPSYSASYHETNSRFVSVSEEWVGLEQFDENGIRITSHRLSVYFLEINMKMSITVK